MNGLSAAQASIWTGHQLAGDKALYNTAECLFFSEKINPTLLLSALNHTVSACESLQSHYRARLDGQGVRIPAAASAGVVTEMLSEDPTEDSVARWASTQDAPRPFDIASELPCRFALFLGPSRDALYMSVHHIALDGFGYQLFLERLAKQYGNLVNSSADTQDSAPALSAVLADEQAFTASPAFADGLKFWREKLAAMDEAARFGRNAEIGRGYNKFATKLPAPLWEALLQSAALAKAPRVNWGDIMTAALAWCLHEATGASTVSIGLPAMNRLGSVAAQVPCMHMNIVPLILSLDDGDTLLSLAGKVSVEKKDMRKHLGIRHELMARERLASGKSANIFGPVINIMPFTRSLRFGHLAATRCVMNSGPAADVTLAVFCESPRHPPDLEFCAHPNVLSAEDLQVKAHQYLDLLAELTADPSVPARGLCAKRRTEALRAQALSSGPLAQPAIPVLARIKQQAVRHPRRNALEHQEHSLTYRQLVDRVETWARNLQDLGVKAGTPVGVLLPRSLDAVTAALAVMEAGGIYVPFDPAQPASRQEILWHTAEARLLITHLVPDRNTFVGCKPVAPTELSRAVSNAPDHQQAEAAYMMFTSGSTGAPKGIVISHAALAHFTAAVNERYQIHSDDRVLQFAPLHFDASIEEIFVTLSNGATLVVRTDDMITSFGAFARACGLLKITVMDLPTAWWNEWSEALATGHSILPQSLHTVILGGEAVTTRPLTQWLEATDRKVRLINSYGPTETTVVALTSDLTDWRPGDDILIGTPLAGLTCLVVGPGGYPDSDGELLLAGPTVGSHYIGITTPLRTVTCIGDAYRTGDRVRRHGSQLSFKGRIDHEVKLSGHRIQPAEIEGSILALPGIQTAAVEIMRSEGGHAELAAFVVTASHSPETLRGALRSALPAAMIPKHIRILPALPKTLAGKIDHAALHDLLRSTNAARTESPRGNDIHGRIRAVWEQEFAPLPVSDEDNFFSLGGQSLQAIQLALRLSQALRREVTVADVLTYPTLSSFARMMEARQYEHAAASTTLVCLSDSAAQVIFAFPGVGGSSAQFLGLAAALKGNACIKAFEAPGPCANGSSEDSAASWATAYADEILAQNPKGTIRLLGHSFGGWLAYESARRLESAGRKVALYLLDTVLPDQTLASTADAFIEAAVRKAPELAGAMREGVIGYQLQLHQRYRPSGAVQGAVWQFSASDTSSPLTDAPWFQGPFYQREVAANHFTMLQEPALTSYTQTIIDSLQTEVHL